MSSGKKDKWSYNNSPIVIKLIVHFHSLRPLDMLFEIKWANWFTPDEGPKMAENLYSIG